MMHGFLKIRKNNLCYHLAHIIWGVCLPRLRRAWLVLYGHGTWWGGDVNKDKQNSMECTESRNDSESLVSVLIPPNFNIWGSLGHTLWEWFQFQTWDFTLGAAFDDLHTFLNDSWSFTNGYSKLVQIQLFQCHPWVSISQSFWPFKTWNFTLGAAFWWLALFSEWFLNFHQWPFQISLNSTLQCHPKLSIRTHS